MSAAVPGAARQLAVFLSRFALASAVLGGGLYAARPLAYAAVARVARDVAALSAPRGFISALQWREPLERFALESAALGLSVGAGSLSLAFILVIPAAFTWALPLAGRLKAAALQLTVCAALASAILAQDLLAIAGQSMEARGISAFPDWQAAFQAGWLNLGWDLGMIAVPAAVCLCALFPLVVAGSEPRGTGGAPRPAWRAAALAGVLVLGLVAGDFAVSRRLSDAAAEERYLRALAERDADLPGYLLDRGLDALGAGRRRVAKSFLERAVLFPETRRDANLGLAAIAQEDAAP